MTATVAVLAGGRGSRIGGDKALVELAGRPLIAYPLRAARVAGLSAVVVAKRSTRLPVLDVPTVIEPDEPTHPLLGIVMALEQFPTVIALPCDMPFVQGAELAALAALPADLATLTTDQPFPSLYRRVMLPRLRLAVQTGGSVRSLQAQAAAPAALGSTALASQFAVNTPADLSVAEARLRRR